eukprot:834869-Prorocentrum_minimum.AAC.1
MRIPLAISPSTTPARSQLNPSSRDTASSSDVRQPLIKGQIGGQEGFKTQIDGRILSDGFLSFKKGTCVDVKGNNVDVKGNKVDVKGNNVDVKGNNVDVKGNNVDVKGDLTPAVDIVPGPGAVVVVEGQKQVTAWLQPLQEHL